MNRELLKKMTKEELIELANRQNDAINSLDEQRYDASAVIGHLVRATHDMQNLRDHDLDRSHNQDYVDDFVREMYGKYPMYLISAEVTKDEERLKNPLDLCENLNCDCGMKGQPLKEEKREENLPDRSAVVFELTIMREVASIKGDDEHAKTLSKAIELLSEDDK